MCCSLSGFRSVQIVLLDARRPDSLGSSFYAWAVLYKIPIGHYYNIIVLYIYLYVVSVSFSRREIRCHGYRRYPRRYYIFCYCYECDLTIFLAFRRWYRWCCRWCYTRTRIQNWWGGGKWPILWLLISEDAFHWRYHDNIVKIVFTEKKTKLGTVKYNMMCWYIMSYLPHSQKRLVCRVLNGKISIRKL